jgi:pimeloyl-ACP methyl ester carboxylesterase
MNLPTFARAAALLAMLLCIPLCRAASQSPATETMHLLSGSGDGSTRAVIVFGGIYESYHYWDSWLPSLAAPQTNVYGFDHNHTSTDMRMAAHLLASELGRLNDAGIVNVTIIAHSMGGLVAKAALDELVASGNAAKFARVELYAFGTPWGGFLFAEPAHILPGSVFISHLIGLPMGPDIGPQSGFMQSLSKPLPANMRLNLYVGSEDRMASPGMYLTRKRYDAVEAIAGSVTFLEGLRHKDYCNFPATQLGLGRASRGVMDETPTPQEAAFR